MGSKLNLLLPLILLGLFLGVSTSTLAKEPDSLTMTSEEIPKWLLTDSLIKTNTETYFKLLDSMRWVIHEKEAVPEKGYFGVIDHYLDSIMDSVKVDRGMVRVLLNSEIFFIGTVKTKETQLKGCNFFKTKYTISIDSLIYSCYNHKKGDTIAMLSYEGEVVNCAHGLAAYAYVSGYNGNYKEGDSHLFALSNLNYLSLIKSASPEYDDPFHFFYFSGVVVVGMMVYFS